MTDKTDSKEREALTAYLKDCDENAIVPDVGGAWHAAFQAGRASMQSSGFDAADMATASAQGFRDGVASIAASAGSEPVAFLVCTEEGDPDMVFLSQHDAQQYLEDHERPTPLYTHPSPPEGMVGGLQVYRCKIKSRKQIDREIPREQQGWWADVAAGQRLLLRQAVQSDLDRCNLGGKRSRNPADYMCETHTYGSLVSKVALEYMNPEENVFAAPPTTSAGSGKGE
ncbi:hypothetical protein [Acidovorax kalamii]|uniref:Uncharacterized protein n=1 Tax=Acidovorax kalamii TaxID=2004485 RepID=A0A235ENU0_9BURK|nr:hypothetical protein [Acidovorax kalamii]OYD50670.1 hypothetical protein CBY09_08015 [Acidovorax kalamii]